MMDLKSIFDQFNQHPDFQKLSYRDQTDARVTATVQTLRSNAEFLRLSPADQKVAIEQIATQAPTFADPDMNNRAQELWQRAASGDEKVAGSLVPMVAARGAVRNSMIAALIGKAVGSESLVGSDADKLWESIYTVAKRTPGLSAKLGVAETASSIVSGLAEAIGLSVAVTPLVGGMVKGAGLASTLGTKAAVTTARGLQGAERAGAAMSIAKAIRAGAPAISQTDNARKIWLATRINPLLASAAAEGLLDLSRQNAIAAINEDPEGFTDSIGKIAWTFGTGAALDFGVNFIAREALPMAWKSAKMTFKKTPPILDIEPNNQVVGSLIDNARASNISDELLATADPITQDKVIFQRATREIALKSLDDIRVRPDADAMVGLANTVGKATAVPEGPNSFRVRGVYDMPDGTAVRIQGTLDVNGLADLAGDYAVQQRAAYAGKKAVLSDEWLQGFEWVETRANSARAIDELWGITPVKKGAIPAGRRPVVSSAEAAAAEASEAVASGQARVLKTYVPFDEKAVSRLTSGESAFGKGQMRLPLRVDENYNVAVLSKKALIEGSEDHARLMAHTQIAARNMGQTPPDEILKFYARNEGFDAIIHADDSFTTLLPEKVKVVVAKTDLRGMPLEVKALPPKALAPADPSAAIEAKMRFQMPAGEFLGDTRGAIAYVRHKFRGPLAPDDVKRFADTMLDKYGYKGKLSVAVDNASEGGVSLARGVADGLDEIRIPKEIKTLSAQEKFTKQLFDKIAELGRSATAKGAKAPETAAAAQKVLKNGLPAWSSRSPADVATFDWVKEAAKREGYTVAKGGSKGGFMVTDRMGVTASHASIEEAQRYVIGRMMGSGEIVSDLANRGLRVVRRGEQVAILSGGKPVAEAPSLRGALDKIDYLPEKIPQRFLPPEIEITGDTVSITVSGSGGITGNLEQTVEFLGKFETDAGFWEKSLKAQVGEGATRGAVYAGPGGDIRVKIPGLGIDAPFADYKSARQFLNQKWDSIAVLKEEIATRGGQLTYTGKGKYRVQVGSDTLEFHRKSDLAKWMEAHPAPQNAPEILAALDPTFEQEFLAMLEESPELKKLYKEWSQIRAPLALAPSAPLEANIKSVVATGLRDQVRALLQSTDWWAENTLDKYGLPELKKIYRKIRNNAEVMSRDISESDDIIRKIFATGKNKIPDDTRMEAMLRWIEAGDDEAQQAVKAAFGEFSSQELQMIDRARGLFDSWKHKFGIDPITYQKNYVSRLRDEIGKLDLDAVRANADAADLLNSARKNGGEISQLGFIERNMRASELESFARNTNLMEVMMLYNRHGHRAMYLEPVWDEMSGYFKANKIPADVAKHMTFFRERLIGAYVPDGRKVLNDMVRGFFTSIGKTSPKDMRVANSAADLFFSSQYITTMGFRPFHGVRNALQPWNMLATRVGNDDVFEGMKIALNGGEKYLEKVTKLGIIRDTPPLVNEIAEVSTSIGRLTRNALGAIKHSDDLGRVMAYGTADHIISRAAPKIKAGAFVSDEALERFAKLHMFKKHSPENVADIVKAMRTGTPEALDQAKYVYAKMMADQAFGLVQQAQAPALYSRGLIGRLFGQMGFFSALHRESIFRGWSGAPTRADKIAFASRYIGNNLAIYGSFAAVGIKATDFIPFQSGFFGGGPNFELAIQAMNAMGSDYEAQLARQKLMQSFSPVIPKDGGLGLNIPKLIPGSVHARFFMKGIEAAEAGDYLKAFYNFTTTPTL